MKFFDIKKKFTSGNSVPVGRAQLTAEEFKCIEELIEKLCDTNESLSSELNHMIEQANAGMKVNHGDLDPPDYYDQQSVFEAHKLIAEVRGSTSS